MLQLGRRACCFKSGAFFCSSTERYKWLICLAFGQCSLSNARNREPSFGFGTLDVSSTQLVWSWHRNQVRHWRGLKEIAAPSISYSKTYVRIVNCQRTTEGEQCCMLKNPVYHTLSECIMMYGLGMCASKNVTDH